MTASVVMISHDLIGPRMAGPGMRYWELARVLNPHCSLTLAAPNGSSSLLSDERVHMIEYPRGDPEETSALRSLVESAEVVIAPGDTLLEFPFLLTCDKILVMDGYDPHTFESLAWNEGLSMHARLNVHCDRVKILGMQCAAGDFFICASDRQRMLWLGWLEAAGRVNPLTYDEDRTLRKLIDTVPTGIPDQAPQRTRPLVRGVYPGVGSEERLLVWGGGVWNWLDPLTLIEAIARVVRTHPEIRLYFPGPRHPYQEFVPDMAMHQAAVRLSQEKGLYGRHVVWGQWVPYHERQNYLLEADIGCSLHFETLESCFAFRTRILDYVWAGLPMIVTRGDATSEWVEEYGLGVVVDYQDVDGVAEAIVHLLSTPRDAFSEGFERARQERSWEYGAQPLVRFCRNPRRAPDKAFLSSGDTEGPSGRHTCSAGWGGSSTGRTLSALDRVLKQEREIERLQSVIAGYERGRFIRFTGWLHRMKQKVLGRV